MRQLAAGPRMKFINHNGFIDTRLIKFPRIFQKDSGISIVIFPKTIMKGLKIGASLLDQDQQPFFTKASYSFGISIPNFSHSNLTS